MKTMKLMLSIAAFALCASLAFNTGKLDSKLILTSVKTGGDLTEEQKNALSKIPDDSMLVCKALIDNIPENYSKIRKEEKVEDFLTENGYYFDRVDVENATIFFTDEVEYGKNIGYGDRLIRVRYTLKVDDQNKLAMRAYASEMNLRKLNNKKWEKLRPQTAQKVSEMLDAVKVNLSRKFPNTNKVQTFLAD